MGAAFYVSHWSLLPNNERYNPLPVRCPSCHRENPHDAAYCGGCGARLEPAAGPEESRLASSPAAVTPPATQPASIASGRYTLGRLLGEGAMKRVYLGHDRRLDREVAIARVELAGLDPAGRLRLEREAQAMARLGDHPNVVTVYDVIEESGAIHIVTQHMAGGDLARRIADAPDGRLVIDEAVAIAIQLCRALEHAHGRGVIHRDLKPGNVWLSEDGVAKLGDFGLALALDRSRLTADGMIVGTVAYMPPEQALGRPRDARSDLYALGATLYQMVTGRPPFVGDDVVAVLSQHLHTPPVAPSWSNAAVPQPLERLILELLAKDPESRPPSAAAVRGRLQAVAAATSTPAPIAARRDANPLDRLAGGVFVGRSPEIERLRAAFEDTMSGRFRLLLLSGEPGIGKTRTAEELTTYARMRGADVVWGRCYEGAGAPPFWPWVQVVRGWIKDREPRELLADLGPGAADVAALVSEVHEALPGLAEPPRLDPEQARFRLFESLTVLLRNATQRRPLVVIIDDLHWADEASLLLLEFLARELGPARLLLLGTYRDVELRRGHPLSETLGALAREGTTDRVLLRGLAPDEVRRFIEQTAGISPPPELVETLYRETEGNPFFVSEVVRMLAAEGRLARVPADGSWSHEIPQGVREVIGRRLNRLSSATQRGARQRRGSRPRLRLTPARPGERSGRDRAARSARGSDGGAPGARGARDAGPLPLRARAGARHTLRGDQRAAACPSPSRRRRSARSCLGRGRGAGPSPVGVGGAAAGGDRAPLLPIGAGGGLRAHRRSLRARGGVGTIATGVGGRGTSSRARDPGAGDDRAARCRVACASWS